MRILSTGILGYKRHLSINMIRGLHDLLGMPLACLIQAYPLQDEQHPKAG
jgi:antitoxin component HigA of HigAB toxin-antitoxin module